MHNNVDFNLSEPQSRTSGSKCTQTSEEECFFRALGTLIPALDHKPELATKKCLFITDKPLFWDRVGPGRGFRPTFEMVLKSKATRQAGQLARRTAARTANVINRKPERSPQELRTNCNPPAIGATQSRLTLSLVSSYLSD
jgi:hypothetical protein